jgi:Mg2+-importing ATPase
MAENKNIFYKSKIKCVFKLLRTSKRGLTDKEAHFRLKRGGLNVIGEDKKVNIVIEFLSHFKSPLVIILLTASLISAFFGEMKNFIVILLIVIASVILDFCEEHRANNAAAKLKEKVSLTTTVIRNGKKKEIKASELCVGDIIFLSTGDLVPADARIIEADDFFVNQSVLTGESLPQEKFPNNKVLIWDYENAHIVLMGTNVVSGTALAVVFQIGKETEFGKIAKNIGQKEDKSGFEVGIGKFSYFISKVILTLVLIIFLGNAIVNKNILDSFLFAVAIAVGVTPELLPMIMSITLASASKQMAKKGVIVKKISTIPNMGSMDILCTDKTGTLTEDNIKLAKYTDINGNEDKNVFLYAYINSFYQIGIRNPLDKAVLDFKKIKVDNYRKVEEIPFNFVRRLMSIAVIGPKGRMLITKGAPEEVIRRCSHYMDGFKNLPFKKKAKTLAVKNYENLSKDGYRVLGIAVKYSLPAKAKYTEDDEDGLIFIGYVSFLDPAKKDTKGVLRELQSHGIEIKVITGDNEIITQKICQDVGLEVKGVVLGNKISKLTDDALAIIAERNTIFARFSPDEKNRIINILRRQGHNVGYLGDGINDAPSLKSADVGISVESAADVAKETADIILTHKSLKVVVNGVQEGRRAFGNTMKYLMMGLSSNFGNMFSVIFAVFYLPFLPMLPIQILLNNFIYDCSQVTIPLDNIDKEWLKKSRKWNMAFVKKFMYIFGPISSIFDVLTFFLLFSVFKLSEAAFQTGWFLESLATQTLVIHIIRTRQIPFLQSRPSKLLFFSTVVAVTIGWIVPITPLGKIFKFVPLPPNILLAIVGLVFAYLIMVELTKRIFYKNNAL